MSLQNLIDWWNEFVKKKQAIPSCGAWPAAVPPWADIFLPCCTDHDHEYIDSEFMYATGVITQDKNLKNRALEIKDIADEEFAACVRARYRKSWFFTKPLTRAWGEEYIKIVLANGDRIWFNSVGVIIAEFESGDHPVVQLALRRAKTHGTDKEEEVIKKAHSKARSSKISH